MGGPRPPSVLVMVRHCLHLMCIQLAWEFFYCVRKGQKSKHYIATPICWHRPNQGWFKLNSDEASQGNPGKASGSGLICDHHGKWIKEYMRNIGNATSIAAAFWALRDGLMLAAQLGITQLLVELDAQVIVNLVQSKKPINSSYSPLLNDYRYLLGQFHCIKIIYIFREANRCVDNLARVGYSLLGNFVVLDSPPTDELCTLEFGCCWVVLLKAFSHYFAFYG